jgi:hypothetical protein
MAGINDLEHEIRYFLRLNDLLSPGYDMAADIAEWRKKFTPSQQRAGLKAAFADTSEMSMNLSLDRIAEFDAILTAEGFMSLTELRLRHGRRIKRLLKSKRLKNEDDAIALKGMLDTGLLTEEEEATVWRLVESFQP